MDKPKSTVRDPASYTSRAKASAPQCVAIKKSGERCKAAPVHGATVCRAHGAAAPQVRKAAALRLIEMQDPAIAEHLRILRKPDTSDADRLKAIQMVYDRTGLKPGVDVSLHGPTPWEQLDEAALTTDRSLPGGPDDAALGEGPHTPEDYEQFAKDAQAENWRALLDAEDEPERLDRYGPNVVQGEVINGTARDDDED